MRYMLLAMLIANHAAVSVQAESPVPIIFDTDMDNECDDAGALAVLHALADEGEAEILAVVTNRRGKPTAD